MLSSDSRLGQFVPERPLFSFKRVKSIKDKLIMSEYRGKLDQAPCKYKGTYMCGTCRYCKYMYTTRNPTLPNGQIFRPKHFANCKTIGVIYILWCGCSCFYIGKTTLEFWERAYKHI